MSPKTVVGLAVKARIYQRNHPDMFECPPQDLDYEDEGVRLLIDEIAAFQE